MKNINIRRFLITILIILCITALFSFQPSLAQKPSSPDELVKSYLSMMSGDEYSSCHDLFETADGYDPEINSTEAYIENFRYPTKAAAIEERELATLLHKQKIFVVSCFGSDAWTNVNYKLSQIPAAEKREKFIRQDTKTEISPDEYEKINHAFWAQYANEKGIKEDVFFDTIKTDNVNIFSEKAKGIKEPAVVELVDSYTEYSVTFTFNGMDVAATGEYNFTFQIFNKYGYWKIISPLKWETPAIPEEKAGD